MNAIANKVRLIGNVGAKPELKTFEKGNSLATFSLATSESWKDQKGNWQDETTWHNLVVWGKAAEIMHKIVDKGSKLCIEGKLKNEKYQSKSGETRYATKVVVSDFMKLDPKKE